MAAPTALELDNATGLVRVEDNLSDALKRNRELKTDVLNIHRPRRYGRQRGGAELRCQECAEFVNGRLRRAQWPCDTAQLFGVTG